MVRNEKNSGKKGSKWFDEDQRTLHRSHASTSASSLRSFLQAYHTDALWRRVYRTSIGTV